MKSLKKKTWKEAYNEIPLLLRMLVYWSGLSTFILFCVGYIFTTKASLAYLSVLTALNVTLIVFDIHSKKRSEALS